MVTFIATRQNALLTIGLIRVYVTTEYKSKKYRTDVVVDTFQHSKTKNLPPKECSSHWKLLRKIEIAVDAVKDKKDVDEIWAAVLKAMASLK